jgi:hypothetical protein
MKYETYKFIEQQYKIYIAKEKLADILPVADIFSATFSSTVQWAVLCEIPAIVFDFYGLNYTCYDFLKGVIKVNEKSKLEKEINRLLNDDEYYKKMAKEQAKIAGYISPFDGKCLERIADVIVHPEKYRYE